MRTILFALVLAAALAVAVPAAAATVVEYDFDDGVGDAWSTSHTFEIDQNPVLGLFNSRHPRLDDSTTLTLSGLPAHLPVTVAFDLYLVGSWEGEGKNADTFTVTSAGGKVLLEMTEFPNRIEDGNESAPVGHDGTVKTPISTRTLGYWIVPLSVTLPLADNPEGEISLTFEGDVSARKVESWAIDNVRVSVEQP